MGSSKGRCLREARLFEETRLVYSPQTPQNAAPHKCQCSLVQSHDRANEKLIAKDTIGPRRLRQSLLSAAGCLR